MNHKISHKVDQPTYEQAVRPEFSEAKKLMILYDLCIASKIKEAEDYLGADFIEQRR